MYACLVGKGRGIVATRDVAPGELLMLVPPLAMLVSAKQERPSPRQLVDHLLRQPQVLHSAATVAAVQGLQGLPSVRCRGVQCLRAVLVCSSPYCFVDSGTVRRMVWPACAALAACHGACMGPGQ